MNFSSNDRNLKFFLNQNSMNGLVNFIAEMRTCKFYRWTFLIGWPLGRLRDLEQKRVNKELANIRYKFKGIWRTAGLSEKFHLARFLVKWIQQEKVRSKAHVYVYPWIRDWFWISWSCQFDELNEILGETNRMYFSLDLMNKGYLAVTLMMGEDHELFKLVTQSIKQDMDDPNEVLETLRL